MKNPFLTGKDLYLSPLTKEDITEEYIGWLNDPETNAGNSHATFPNTYTKTLSYIESIQNSKSEIVLAIKMKKGNVHIGNVSLQNINWVNRSGEIAMIIGNKKNRSKGVGTEVMALIIDYAFNTLNLNRISCGTPSTNTGGIRICENNNMKKEGVQREVLYKNGEYLDSVLFAILKKDHKINNKK